MAAGTAANLLRAEANLLRTPLNPQFCPSTLPRDLPPNAPLGV
jgi:hypothetical protein